jgi:tetratricopeptide (TPR) repeat protein
MPFQIVRQYQEFACLAAVLMATGCSRNAKDYLERGNKFFAAGKFGDSTLAYQNAIRKDPNLGEAYYRLALADEHRNEGAEAFQALNRAVALMPQNEEAMAKLADLSFDGYISSPSRPKPLYDTVATMADRLVAKNPQSFDGFRLKGNLALVDQHPKEAVEFLQKANQIRPMNRDVVLSLTQALIQDNRSPEAEQLGLQLIKKEKNFGMIYDVLHRQYLAMNRQADAEKILQTKADSNPKEAAYLLQLAAYYARGQKRDRMAQTLQRLLNNPADFPQARLLVGDFYNSLGDREEAMRQFEEGMRPNSKDKPIYQTRIARILAAQNKRDDAVHMLDAVLKEHPDNDEAAMMRATYLLESQKPENREAAVRDFKELVRRKPADVSLRYSLGMAYVLKGELDAAKTELREAVRLQSRFDQAKFLLANISLVQNAPAESLRYADEILASAPEQPSARLVRVQSLMRLNRHGEARAELNRLARQFPQSLEVQLQLGALAVLEKKYAEAEGILQKLRKSGPGELRATFGLAEAYARRSEFDKALQLLSEEAKKTQDVSVRRMLAETAVRAERYDLAIAEYERLLSADPKSAGLRLRLGNVYHAKGDLNKAIDLFQQAQELAPKDLEISFSLAGTLYEAGKSSDALAIYRRLASSRPDDPDALNDVAYMLCETGGNLDEALKFAQRAVQKSPEQAGFVDTLGWVYLKKGMTDTAVQLFGNAAQKDPENAAFRYHLGVALLQKGEKNKARTEFQAALTKKPQQADEKKIRELLAGIS